jgi:hypothetical protein
MGIASYSGASSVIKPGVVTSSTRPSSPFVGQLIYDTTVSQTLAWNGSAWIVQTGGGLTPVIPTSVTVTGGTGTFSTSTGTVTATGVNDVMINGVFTSKYNAYRVLFQGSATTNSFLKARFSTGGTVNSSANYAGSVVRNSYAAGTFSVYGYDPVGTYFTIGDVMPTSPNVSSTLIMDIGSPFTAAYTSMTSHSARDDYFYVFGGNYKATTSFDGIWFAPSTTPMTVTITVYGYNT